MESVSRSLYAYGKRLIEKIGEDDVNGAAAEMAYRFFLALFPFFIFLAALSGFVASTFNVDDPTTEIMDLLGDSLPDDASSVLEEQLRSVTEQRNGGLLTLGILGAIWATSGGISALMKNMNRMYSVGESRSRWARYAISLGLTFLSAGVLVLAFVLFFTSQVYGPRIADEAGLADTARTLISLALWPATLLMIMFAVAFLYWLAPNAGLRLRWISPGAIFFTLTWLIASFGFGLYVANFGSYNATYGALGGVVVLLIWFYLTAFLLLVGAEINAAVAEKETGSEAPTGGRQAVAAKT
jgi:membrane protein